MISQIVTFLEFIKLNLFYISSPSVFSQPNKRKCQLTLFIVAFNNVQVIEWQLKLFAKFLKDSYCLWIIDNSSNLEASLEIQEMCLRAQINYIRVPKNPLPHKGGSFSHGMAVNWALRKIDILSDYFSVLDHDIFPMEAFSVIDKVKSHPYYGHVQDRGSRWYLWPGYCFFNLNKISRQSLNFLPIKGLDTGGSNWETIYRFDSHPVKRIPIHRYARLTDLLNHSYSSWNKYIVTTFSEAEQKELVAKDELIEFLDSWIHLFNASNWKGTKDKSDAISRVLKKVITHE